MRMALVIVAGLLLLVVVGLFGKLWGDGIAAWHLQQ